MTELHGSEFVYLAVSALLAKALIDAEVMTGKEFGRQLRANIEGAPDTFADAVAILRGFADAIESHTTENGQKGKLPALTVINGGASDNSAAEE
jgi:hypothetical protein